MNLNDKYRYTVAVIAILGLGIMSYLTYIHFSQAESFCDISDAYSCEAVNTSIYSEVFGIPVSILGLGYFGVTLLLMLFQRKQSAFQALFFLTLFVLIPSLYLTSLEIFFIYSICVLCESAKALMLIILILSFIIIRKTGKVNLRASVPIIIAGFIAVGVMYFAQTATVATKDYSQLISCLNDNGLVYYKSVRCSNCKRQEQLLGSAYTKLNSVECHPEGENPQPELCLEKGISKTPTFLIEKDGQEIDRLVGLQKVEDLADFGGCSIE